MKRIAITLAILFVPMVVVASPNEPMVEVTSDHLWRADLQMGKIPYWDGIHQEMTIAPTEVNGKIRAPRNLRDAWHELDRMLPANYALLAASLSGRRCLDNASDEVVALQNALADFGYENWIAPRGFSYRRYLVKQFHLSIPDAEASSENDRDAARTAMGWTLCYYYQQKHDPRSFDMNAAKRELKEQLNQVRAERRLSSHK